MIDALFGAGLARDIDGEAKSIIDRMNEFARAAGMVLAVDVPSGVDGRTGKIRGAAVEASASVTFFRLKPGHLLQPGRTLAGAIRLADIGIPEAALTRIGATSLRQFVRRLGRSAARPERQQPQIRARRGSRPVGPRASYGRRPARRSRGAACGSRHCQRGEPARRARGQFRAFDGGDGRALRERKGVRRSARRRAPPCARSRTRRGRGADLRKLVAAALTMPADNGRSCSTPTLSQASRATRRAAALIKRGHQTVMTPHEGEFAKLFKGAADVRAEDDKLTRARAAARLTGAVVLIKGADTVVAAPDGRATIGWDLPPWLATAGSGDVLAGLVAGLAAQDMPPFEAASAAVWLHGACGRAVGPGLIAEDLPEALPGVLRALEFDAAIRRKPVSGRP